jgi:signal transduction histidine kinase
MTRVSAHTQQTLQVACPRRAKNKGLKVTSPSFERTILVDSDPRPLNLVSTTSQPDLNTSHGARAHSGGGPPTGAHHGHAPLLSFAAHKLWDLASRLSYGSMPTRSGPMNRAGSNAPEPHHAHFAGGPGMAAPLNELGNRVPRTRRYIALWLALACITAIVILAPSVPVAIYQPRLSVAIGAVSGVIGLALLQLGLLRFRVLRRPIDLHIGLAFGVLATGDLFAAFAASPVNAGTVPLENAYYFTLLVRAIAIALFLLGLASTYETLGAWSTRIGRVCAALFGVMAFALIFSSDDNLPPLVDPSVRTLLASGQPIPDLLPGQHPTLVLANVALSVALLACASGYTGAAHRLRDSHLAALGAGLVLIFFGQVQAILFPSLPTEYVASGDLFRLVAYGLLLSYVMSQTAQDFAATATHNERLRLSRELHDGLAQQLAMLRLRLGHVTELTTPSDPRSHDLEVAQRVLESATSEARRAIAALRYESVPWDHFGSALFAFSEQFSLTHDVDARVWIEPSQLLLDSQVQGDVLRILQEAFSNAARHGQAKRIEAVMAPRGDALSVTIWDDGTGFDPAHAARGVGLRSMAERVELQHGRLVLTSRAGSGTKIQAWLPLRASAPESI